MVSRYLAEMEQWVGAAVAPHDPPAQPDARRRRNAAALPADAGHGGDLRSAVSTPDDTPKGLLRITTSMSFGSRHLAGIVADYVKLHPGTSVDLMLVERAVNLVEERVDLAVRITNDLDPNLIARKLAVCRSVVCASGLS